jgi:hypothetical protein
MTHRVYTFHTATGLLMAVLLFRVAPSAKGAGGSPPIFSA